MSPANEIAVHFFISSYWKPKRERGTLRSTSRQLTVHSFVELGTCLQVLGIRRALVPSGEDQKDWGPMEGAGNPKIVPICM